MSRYCKLEIIELADEKTPDNASEQVNLNIKAKEGDRILTAIKDDAYVIALAIEGKMLDSVELSEKVDKLGISGKSNITFVIGGSLGLDERVLKQEKDEEYFLLTYCFFSYLFGYIYSDYSWWNCFRDTQYKLQVYLRRHF